MEMETWIYGDGDMEIWRHRHRDISIETQKHEKKGTWRHGHGISTFYKKKSNGKRKPRQFSLTRLRFFHCANRSLSFVRLLTKKEMEVIRLQAD